MMKSINKWFAGGVVCMIAGLLPVGSAMAAVPLNNPLPTYNRAGNPAILFTDVDVEYKPGRTKRRSGGGDTGFTAFSSSTSLFSLRKPGSSDVGFDGYMELHATITPKGVFRNGWFEITSADHSVFPEFIGGSYERCNQKGKACKPVNGLGLVFGGELNAFGWSGTQGILEFSTFNLGGLAYDLYGGGAVAEHWWIDVGVFDLNDASSVHTWTGVGNGMAIIPIPAAVWLFGSGLLGLMGFARRKQLA